jgi:macrolide-specific efflux system membrane fusion protein
MPQTTTDAPSTQTPARAQAVGRGVSGNTGKTTRAGELRRRRWLYAGLALTVLAGAIGAWGWQSYGRAAPDQVVTAVVERGDIEDSITALGNLQPRDYVDVGTQVSGQLKKLYFEIGDKVQKGELLAEIDPTVYLARVDADKAQLLNLRAQLTDKKAQLVLAQQQLQRQTSLMKANATSQDAFQSADATARSAAAQVAAIEAQIQQTDSTLKGDEANLDYTKIYAPMAGSIVSETAKEGQTLNANQQAPIILRIAELSTMTVWTQVSEADVSKLRVGMDAYFSTLGQADRRWNGKLRQILPTPEVLNNVILYDALFDVPNPTQELMTQMSAQVFFVAAAAKDAVTVPVASLRPLGAGRRAATEGRPARPADAIAAATAPANAAARSPSRFAVRVMKDDGSIEERHVTVGVTNRVSAQVVDGLQPGEKVVVGVRSQGAAPASQRPPGGPGSRMGPRLS